jgi:hypothetical protein
MVLTNIVRKRILSGLGLLLLLVAAPIQTVHAVCVQDQQACASFYGVSESFFGSGGELNACSTTYCTKQAAGELAVGTSTRPSLASEIVSDTPLAFWKLDETSGTTVTDQMGSYTGTIVGSPALGQPGLPSGGYSMGFGAGNYIDFGNVLNLAPDSTMALEAWIIMPSGWVGGQFLPIITKGDTSYRLARGNTGDNVQFATQSSGVGSLYSNDGNPPLGDGQWHHIVAQMNGSSKAIYIDGSLASTGGSTGHGGNANSLMIGANSGAGGRYFYGRMANVAVYDHDLTASRITAHYSAGKSTVQAGFNTNREESLEMLVNTSSVNMGTLSTTTTATGTATFSVKAYLASGYQVVTSSPGPKNSTYTMASPSTPTASSAGTEQFGINLVANNSCGGTLPGSLGASPVQVPDSTFSFGVAASGYNTACQFKYVNGQTIASSSQSSGETDYTISYIMNISNLTRGGTYNMDQSLVATGTY